MKSSHHFVSPSRSRCGLAWDASFIACALFLFARLLTLTACSAADDGADGDETNDREETVTWCGGICAGNYCGW